MSRWEYGTHWPDWPSELDAVPTTPPPPRDIDSGTGKGTDPVVSVSGTGDCAFPVPVFGTGASADFRGRFSVFSSLRWAKLYGALILALSGHLRDLHCLLQRFNLAPVM